MSVPSGRVGCGNCCLDHREAVLSTGSSYRLPRDVLGGEARPLAPPVGCSHPGENFTQHLVRQFVIFLTTIYKKYRLVFMSAYF